MVMNTIQAVQEEAGKENVVVTCSQDDVEKNSHTFSLYFRHGLDGEVSSSLVTIPYTDMQDTKKVLNKIKPEFAKLKAKK